MNDFSKRQRNLGNMKKITSVLLTLFTTSVYSSDFSRVNLSWNTVAFQAEYALHLHLDIPLDDGTVRVENCISSEILGLQTHVVFKGVCPTHPELGIIPLSNIISFEIEAAMYGDWGHAHSRQSTFLESHQRNIVEAHFPSFKNHETDHYVYVLAGQSNMLGIALYNETLDRLNPTGNVIPSNVEYYLNGERVFKFSTDTVFGPEISFIRNVSEKHPDKHIIILKYAGGGTNIGQWLAIGGFIDQVVPNAAFIIGNRKVAIKAVLWMQGEADVLLQSQTYKNDLKQLIDKFRYASVLGGTARSLPFVFGRVHHYIDDDPRLAPALDFVRRDQEAVGDEDNFSYMLSTDSFVEEEFDPWHFDGLSQLSFGRCLFDVVENIIQSEDCPLLSLEE